LRGVVLRIGHGSPYLRTGGRMLSSALEGR
jgi:hypothetical protein